MNSGRRGAGIAVFVAIVSAVCATVMLSGCTRQPAAGGTDVISSSAPVSSLSSSNADAAEQVAAEALALVRLPRGSRPIAPPSSPSATDDAVPAGSTLYLADEQRWYSVPTTVSALLRYVADRIPVGFLIRVNNDSEVDFEGAATAQYDAPEILVTATSDGNRAVVAVDAAASWRPVRSADELIPDAATTAVLAENGTGGAPARVRLTPTQSHALAQVFNSLWAVSPPQYPLACAMGTTISASFTWPGNELDFVPDCEGIGVLANGVAQSELEDSYDLLPVRDAFFAFAASPPPPPAGPSPNPSSSPLAPSTEAVSPSPTGPHVVLTNADQGRGITVAVGTFIDVNLKASPPTTVDPAVTDDYFVLEPLDFSSGSTSTSQASFRAAAKGNVKLFAMTRPVCATFPACGAAPVFEFDVTVIARP